MYIGIDLGGTKTAGGLVDDSGAILKKVSYPTPSYDTTAITDNIVRICRELSEGNEVTAIGIASPGIANPKTGIIVKAANLHMYNLPITSIISEAMGIPSYLGNDANIAAYGEYKTNWAKYSSFILVTLGTGIGGGIIANNEIVSGTDNCAGEMGHIVVETNGRRCPCGRKGCWEQYASATALCRDAAVATSAYPDSILAKLYFENNREMNGKIFFEALQAGCMAAEDVFKDFCHHVSEGIVDIINIFDPPVIAIGGGISKTGETLLAPIRELVKKNAIAKHTIITEATLHNDAGIIGAALFAKEEQKKLN